MITTNTGAKIIEGSDNWREIFPNGSDPGAHNASVLAHDAGIEGLQDALGIVVDGDQAAVSASKGQYIILKNSTITGCTDGLYTATKAIPANTSIDNTYLSAVSGGGLNALNTQITDMKRNTRGNSIILSNTAYTTTSDGYAIATARGADGYASIEVYSPGDLLFGSISLKGTSDAFSFQNMIYVKKGMKLVGIKGGSSVANAAVFYPLI